MDFKTFTFFTFSAILLFSAMKVITARNPVHSALFLVLTFFNAAGIWMLLEAEFLAITLVLVYVGAVMVLFLFVVMMLDIKQQDKPRQFWSYLPLGGVIGGLIVVEMALIIVASYLNLDSNTNLQARSADYSNAKELGRLIYTDYVLPFELASVILLVAIIAAIALTLRKRKQTKYQNPAQQVTVRKEDRVRIVKLDGMNHS